MSASKRGAGQEPNGELLLEVRAEEIPTRMLEPAVKELAERLFEDLTTRGLGPRRVETGYTPRRLMLILAGVPETEPDREERLMGPPAKVAFDGDGNPTKALLGFAKRVELEPEELERIDTDRGEYVSALRSIVGRPAPQVLAEMVPEILRELSWAKNMHWGTGTGPWVRPVHGVVALFNGEVVPFELFGVASGDTTVGHPVLSPEPFAVTSAEDYRSKLAERQIEIDPRERRRQLYETMSDHARKAGGSLVEDDELLDRLAAVCAIPGVVAGELEERFLELPREVLIASLKDHQSAFTVEDEAGELRPAFLTVMDRPDDPIGRVKAGNEWVVAARLEDGVFFHREDRKRTLAERAPDLERLTFHVKLGSYADKAQRLTELSRWLCGELGWEGEAEAAAEAAVLLKVDLATEMVKEFSSLQGVMGGIYAREQGHEEAVWQAIYDQYKPASAGDELPRGRVGQVTALADRMDTLVGILGIGLKVSGSKDPFGLRRAAQGVVRLLLEGDLRVSPLAIAERARQLYGERLKLDAATLRETLRDFLLDRVRHLLGRQGLAYDEIEAGLAAGSENLPDLQRRVHAVHGLREQPGFLSVALSAKRIANILKDQPPRELDASRLEDAAEQDLHRAAEALQKDVEQAVAAGDYEAALERVGELADTLDRFFDEVMVMAEDETLRNNRVALLQSIDGVISPIAHLTELVVDKAEHRGRAEA
ncbi:MAG: glycine--tRNA ligase subunit beta [Acidobacteriota bacterium]|nr:glycine--tRNA ligase subunit beta [Acidobacteriota bacterium]